MRISDWSSDVCSSDLHVLLAADHLAAAQLDQDRTGVETVIGRSLLSVAEEARIDPGIAERERFAVDAHRAVLQRPDEILRCVHQLHHIAAVIPALAIYRGNEHLERRVARARAHSGQAGVDARSEEHKSELQSLMR